MNVMLIKSVLVFIPVATPGGLVCRVIHQKPDAGTLRSTPRRGMSVVVVLTHIAGALRLFAFMRWGREHSAGHYVDLSSALLAPRCCPSVICGTARRRRSSRFTAD